MNDAWVKVMYYISELINDKTALITGSTAGIGFVIAESLGNEGASVIINARKADSVAQAVESPKATTGGKTIGFAGDLSQTTIADALAVLWRQYLSFAIQRSARRIYDFGS